MRQTQERNWRRTALISGAAAAAVIGCASNDNESAVDRSMMAKIKSMPECVQLVGIPDPDNPGNALINIGISLTDLNSGQLSSLTPEDHEKINLLYFWPDTTQVYRNGIPIKEPTESSYVRMPIPSPDTISAVAHVATSLGELSCSLTFEPAR